MFACIRQHAIMSRPAEEGNQTLIRKPFVQANKVHAAVFPAYISEDVFAVIPERQHFVRCCERREAVVYNKSLTQQTILLAHFRDARQARHNKRTTVAVHDATDSSE